MSLANGPSDPSVTVQIKSKFEMEFRRISAPRSEVERLSLESFYRLVTDAHCLPRSAPVLICYQNPRDMRQTPLQSVEELKAALASSAPLLRLFVSRIRGLIVEVGFPVVYIACHARDTFLARSLGARKKLRETRKEEEVVRTREMMT